MEYTDVMLQRFRTAADPLADQAVAALAGQGEVVAAVLPRLVAVPRPSPGALPESIEHWLRTHARLPAGADRVRLNRASALWVKHGPTMALILGTASLAECYAAALGVRALTFSDRLRQDTLRRLRETVLWVNLIMLPGGLDDQGEGVRAVYQVRLMHAAVRHLLLRSGQWETERLGLPLCQEDMAGTLMTFAHTVPRSMHRLGIRLTEQETADYHYFWTVVGEMMGVRPELIPADPAGARALSEQIFRRQHAASPEGRALTQAMLQTYGGLLPGQLLRRTGFFPALIRWLSGDAVADLLGVPAARGETAMRYYRLVGPLADFGWRTSTAVRRLRFRLPVRRHHPSASSGAGRSEAG